MPRHGVKKGLSQPLVIIPFILLSTVFAVGSTIPVLATTDTANANQRDNGLERLPASARPNFEGEWLIQEEDKSYQATLDESGQGRYTWQDGRMVIHSCAERRCKGTWHQPGNDRQGGFEVLLSEELTRAEGVWWYTRVGERGGIPPRAWGGSFTWERLTPVPQLAHAP